MANNILYPHQFITNASMGASYTATPFTVQMQDNVGIQLQWTGTPTGTFAVQVSVDYSRDGNGNVLNAGNWSPLTLSASISAAGSADVAYIDLNQISAPWIRIVYTRSSGTGTLNGYCTGKGV